MTENQAYSRSVYRVPFLLDIYAESDRAAFERLNRIMRLLADREDKNTAQVGYETVTARKQIAGACVYVDQLRKVVAPAVPHPLPDLSELVGNVVARESAIRLTPPNARQLAFADVGSEPAETASLEVEPGRGSAAD